MTEWWFFFQIISTALLSFEEWSDLLIINDILMNWYTATYFIPCLVLTITGPYCCSVLTWAVSWCFTAPQHSNILNKHFWIFPTLTAWLLNEWAIETRRFVKSGDAVSSHDMASLNISQIFQMLVSILKTLNKWMCRMVGNMERQLLFN